MRLNKLISGGQTGVDTAALRAALAFARIAIGGYCPPDSRNDDGAIPTEFGLTPTEEDRSPLSPDVPHSERTERNVTQSDGTLILTPDLRFRLGEGTRLTIERAKHHKKPVLVVSPESPGAILETMAWIRHHSISTLNVAGPKSSEHPTITEKANKFFESLLEALSEQTTYGAELPDWFKSIAASTLALSGTSETNGIIVRSIDQMYAARAAFKDDAKNAITVLGALLGGAGVLVAQSFAAFDESGARGNGVVPSLLSIVVLVAVQMTCGTYRGKLYAGYRLYVASAMHAAALLAGRDFGFTHQWFRDVAIRCQSRGWFFKRRSDRPEQGGWPRDLFVHEERGHTVSSDWLLIDEEGKSTKPKGRHWTIGSMEGVRCAGSLDELGSVWMEDPGNLSLLHERTMAYVRLFGGILMASSLGVLVFSFRAISGTNAFVFGVAWGAVCTIVLGLLYRRWRRL